MLADIDKVDWQALNAPDVPTWLQDFTSQDVQTYRHAYYSLLENVVLKDELNEVAIQVIPFFIELLSLPDSRKNGDVLNMLYELLTHFFYGIDANGPLTRRIYPAVSVGLDRYMALIFSRDLRVRKQAVELLHLLNREVEQLSQKLIALLVVEDDDQFKADLLWILGDIIAGDAFQVSNRPFFVHLFENLIEAATTVEFRLASSLSVVKLLKADSPIKAVEIIVEHLSNVDDLYVEAVWGRTVSLCKILAELGNDKGVPALLEALLKNRDAETTFYIMFTIFDLIFHKHKMNGASLASEFDDGKLVEMAYRPLPPDGNEDQITMLTKEQKQTLQVIADTDRMWEVRTTLFEMYGLPVSREGLYQLINHTNYLTSDKASSENNEG